MEVKGKCLKVKGNTIVYMPLQKHLRIVDLEQKDPSADAQM